MRLLLQLLAVAVVGMAGGQAIMAAEWNVPLTLVIGVATAVLTLAVYRFVVSRTEKRAPAEVALKGAGKATALGLAVGLGWFFSVIANITFLGYYEVDGLGSWTGPIAFFGFTAGAAVTEEVLFRGVLFRVLEERAGTWISLLVTGALFGLWHATEGVYGAVVTALAAGGMLAAAYAATRSLWFTIGLHFAWNYAGGGIFGTAVSGQDAPKGLLDGVTSGPTLLSGGDFGPEGSMYTVGFGLLLTAAFVWLARRRDRMVPVRGSKDKAKALV